MELKGEFAHFTMCIFTFNQLTLTSEMKFRDNFFIYSPEQKKTCNPGDEAMLRIHTNLFIGMPVNFTFSTIFPKVQGLLR